MMMITNEKIQQIKNDLYYDLVCLFFLNGLLIFSFSWVAYGIKLWVGFVLGLFMSFLKIQIKPRLVNQYYWWIITVLLLVEISVLLLLIVFQK